MNKIKIKLISGFAGRNKRQIENVLSLGLKRINDVVEQPDNPQTRGKIKKVRHMLEIVK